MIDYATGREIEVDMWTKRQDIYVDVYAYSIFVIDAVVHAFVRMKISLRTRA